MLPSTKFILICIAASPLLASAVDDALCLALSYCTPGAMMPALRGQGFSRAHAQQAIAQASQKDRRCSCSHSCHYFGTCCEDNASHSFTVAVNALSGKKCLQLPGGMGPRIVDVCPWGLPDSDSNKLMCTDSPLGDSAPGYPAFVSPLSHPYVTSAATGLTYRNRWCGLCNNEGDDNLMNWHQSDPSNCYNGGLYRVDCLLEMTPPIPGTYGGHPIGEELMMKITMERLYNQHNSEDRSVCDIQVIRSCPEGTPMDIWNNCRWGYTSVVQDSLTGLIYSNEACAQCNGVTSMADCFQSEEDPGFNLLGNEEDTDGLESTTSSATSSSSTSSTSTSTSTSTTMSIIDTFGPIFPDGEGTSSTGSTTESTSSSSSSTTSGTTSTSTSTSANTTEPGEALFAERVAPGFPHGTILVAGIDGHERGVVFTDSEEAREHGVNGQTPTINQTHDPEHGLSSGTQINTSNPRGSVIMGAGENHGEQLGGNPENNEEEEQGPGVNEEESEEENPDQGSGAVVDEFPDIPPIQPNQFSLSNVIDKIKKLIERMREDEQN